MRQDYSPFSVALIDVFASALGVFMIFAVISLPYIFNTEKQPASAPAEQAIADVTSAQTETQAPLQGKDVIEELVNIIDALKQENGELKKKASMTRGLYEEDFSMQLPILFDGNQWYIRPEATSILDMMGRELTATEVAVTIVGHTSGDPTARRFCSNFDQYGDVNSRDRVTAIAPVGQAFKKCFNDSEWRRFLSTKRAETIKAYLVDKYNLDPHRIDAYGVGSDNHMDNIAADDTRNRRVEVTYSSNKET